MSDRFWQDLLEPEEELLWTGRPRPKLSLRNFQLFGPFVGAIGTVIAGAFVLRGNTLPVSQSVVVAVIVALVALSLLRGMKRLTDLRRTRYALTNHRALFFKLTRDGTRAKAFPRGAETKPDLRPTSPPSVFFIRHEQPGNPARAAHLGFEYVEDSDRLSALMVTPYKGATR